MKQKNQNDFQAYSVLEISQMLGVGKTKTRELLDSGILPVTKIGRQYFTSPCAALVNKNWTQILNITSV